MSAMDDELNERRVAQDEKEGQVITDIARLEKDGNTAEIDNYGGLYTETTYIVNTTGKSAYGEDDVTFKGTAGQVEAYAATAKEATAVAADFRQDQYASYRDKYLQHSGTALGTSNTVSRGVVIG